MARTLAQLKAECDKNRLSVVQTGREAKGPYEKALREFYWHRDFGSEPMPPQLHPMLARNLKDVPEAEAEQMWNSPRWVAQEKIDGCRLLMFIGPNGSRFTSRRISDKTYRYTENTEQVPHLAKITHPDLIGTVLDGEVVCSRPDVNTGAVKTKHQLQATVALLAIDPKQSERIQREQNAWLQFRVFDILQDRGRDVTGETLSSRIERVKSAVHRINQLYPGIEISFVPYVAENKKEYYESVVKAGGEGIMLKDLQSAYTASSSRTKAMYKVKRFEELDLFVTGYVRSNEDAGWANLIGALELSAYVEGSEQGDSEIARAFGFVGERSTHVAACAGNMTLDDRIAATACKTCGRPVHAVTENVNGKRIVQFVDCREHGPMTPDTIKLNDTWLNKVYVVRGMEFTARVYRLFQARLISERNDKAPEDCTIDLKAIQAKFDAKGAETGIVLKA